MKLRTALICEEREKERDASRVQLFVLCFSPKELVNTHRYVDQRSKSQISQARFPPAVEPSSGLYHEFSGARMLEFPVTEASNGLPGVFQSAESSSDGESS